MIGLQNDQKPPKDLGKAEIEHDEKMVKKCVSLIEELANPFQKSEKLTSLSSGKQATGDVKQDLLKARATGEKQLQQFIDNQISSDNVGSYEPIKQLNLKTFTYLQVKKTTKVKGKEHTVEASLKTYSRFIILQDKNVIYLSRTSV